MTEDVDGLAARRRHGMPEPVRSEWGEAVRAALERANMSANAAASEIPISAASFSAWLSGATQPPLSAMKRISEITDLSYNLLLELAGWMPEGTRAATYQMQAAGQLKRALHEVQQWTSQWNSQTGLGPAASVAGLIIQNAPEFEVMMHADIRGRDPRYLLHQATYLGFVRRRPADLPASFRRRRNDPPDKDRLDEVRRDHLPTTAAQWRPEALVHRWERAPSLVLMCPYHERTRAPAVRLRPADWTQIAVVGVNFSHAESIAGFIADRLDLGYMNSAWVTQERYGLTRDDDPQRVVQAGLVKEWLTGEPSGTLANYVLTWADPQVHELTGIEVRDWPGRVIFIEASDRVLSIGAELWNRSPEELFQDQELVKATLTERRTNTSSKFLQISADDPQDEDTVWDAAMRLADELLLELAAEDVVPESATAGQA
jgi:transcriptional regulator with XRE-family HTH domain